MPSITEIKTAFEAAIKARIDNGDLAYPVAWPNRKSDPARPFVLFDHVPTNWENVTIDGSETRADGYVIFAVCIADGVFTNQAEQIADMIAGWFPPSLRIGGGVCITDGGHLRGYSDGIGWREPVRIDYRTE